MVLTMVVLTSCLAFQDPPKPPPEKPRVDESTRDGAKGGATVDVELRAAIEELRRANGYKFEIDGSAMAAEKRAPLAGSDDVKPDPQRDEQGDKAGAGGEKVAHAKEAPHRESFHLTGAWQKDKPAQLKSDKLEAFRSSDKLVWRGKDQKEWASLAAQVGEPPKSDTDKNEKVEKGGDDARAAALLAHLPLPDDLLRDFETRLVSCQRAPGADAKGGMASWECVLSPGGDAKRADAKSDGKNCLVRLSVAQGRITEIDWRHPAEKTASIPQPPAGGTAGPSIVCHYMISDVGSAQVTVPEDAAKLLGSR